MKQLFHLHGAILIIYMLLVGIVFQNWFSTNPLTGGDWEYHFSETLKDFPLFPSSWNNWFGMGFGVNLTFFMSVNSYSTATTSFLHNHLGVPWVLIERLFWFWPFLIVSSYGSYRLVRALFPDITKQYLLVSSAVYTFNTYSLMLVGGGQMGVALSYALAPLVLSLFVNLLKSFGEKKLLMRSVVFGLVFSLQLMLDIRIAYVTFLILGLYGVWNFFFFRKTRSWTLSNFFFFTAFIPFAVSVSLHLWWILPFFFSTKDPLSSLSDIYLNVQSVAFFSFSSFSSAFSLLQPNWPENIFGKTSFLKPEFLILPLLAFSSLAFVQKQKINAQSNVLFFCLTALLGTFLAKGANEPFGDIYLWLFDHVPGFYMFRDPTKWYALIAVSYAALIPFSIFRLNAHFETKTIRKNVRFAKIVFNILLLLIGLYLIHPALTGQLKGTFMARSVPTEYIDYKNFMHKDVRYGRVLWMPQKNRYSFYSALHPNIDAKDYFQVSDPKKLVAFLAEDETQALLRGSSIRYVAVPSDPYGEIFLDDRQYSQELKDFYDREIESALGGFESEEFEGMTVYIISASQDLFSSGDADIVWSQQSMTNYKVSSQKPFSNLTFTAGYDPDWKVFLSGREISSQSLQGRFNLFQFPEETTQAEIVYAPQKWVERGLLVSFTALLGYSFFLFLILWRAK